MSSSKYAGLLFPVKEYHEIPPFRFPIYHDLVPGEAKEIEKLTREQSRSTYESIKLAKRVAKDKKIPVKEALDLLSSIKGDEDSEILYDYIDDLNALQKAGMSVTEQQVVFVTVFIRYRGEAQLGNKKTWEPLPDWTEVDTESIPSKVMGEIFQLILWERDGWPEGKSPVNQT